MGPTSQGWGTGLDMNLGLAKPPFCPPVPTPFLPSQVFSEEEGGDRTFSVGGGK